VITLYHCADARSLRPLWTLEELGLDYELKLLPFPPRVFAKEYLAINPLGTIPFFVDGDAKMTESSGICAYLVAKYGPTSLAIAPDEGDYASYLNWLFFSDATLTFPQTLVLRYTRLEPPERRPAQAADDYAKFFFGRLRAVETALGDREFLSGGRFTIADVCIAYALHLADSLPPLAEKITPNARAYLERMRQRPAFLRAQERQKA
jgi:glutathione S-transferase